MQHKQQHYLVIGMGVTGYSMIRYLLDCGYAVSACDTRDAPPYAEKIQQQFPMVPQISGVPYALFNEFDHVVVSPGVKIAKGYDVVGDIELFVREVDTPMIAITGSNGKSTVTMLVQILLTSAGQGALVGGNIGTPVLDLLAQPKPNWYVLELSSFQLETTYALQAASACVLNLSADHMDRYADLAAYREAKMRVYDNAKAAVINRQQMDIYSPQVIQGAYTFGLDCPKTMRDFGVRESDGVRYFAQGDTLLCAIADMSLAGEHNCVNVLAACAIVAAAGVPISQEMLHKVCQYSGLEHRCELVAQHQGVLWINDSKGTNVGATCAAIAGFDMPITLLAGGVGKGADFQALGQAMDNKVSHLIVFGEDAKRIAAVAPSKVKVMHAQDLAQAVEMAKQVSIAGSTVLFSPACASFDMFRNFEQRGDIFKDLVMQLVVTQEVLS